MSTAYDKEGNVKVYGSKIQYIYGVSIDLPQFIRIFADQIRKIYQENIIPGLYEEHHDPVDGPNEDGTAGDEFFAELKKSGVVETVYANYIDATCEIIDVIPGENVFPYPHYGELNNQHQWIIGVVMPGFGSANLFKPMGLGKISRLEFPGGDNIKSEWQKVATQYKLTDTPDVYQRCDDCWCCT